MAYSIRDVGDMEFIGLKVTMAGGYDDAGDFGPKVPTDATALRFLVRSPSGTVTTYVLGVDDAVTKSGTGNYYVSFVLSEPGFWTTRSEATLPGDVPEIEEFRTYARPSLVI